VPTKQERVEDRGRFWNRTKKPIAKRNSFLNGKNYKLGGIKRYEISEGVEISLAGYILPLSKDGRRKVSKRENTEGSYALKCTL